MTKNYAIIVAAGKGKRMGSTISKQFLEIKGKPVLYYTLNVFSKCSLIDNIILVLSPEDIEYCNSQIINRYNFKNIIIVEGGKERQDSVYNGLKAAENCDVVLIHDGARPFVDSDSIEKGIKYAKIYGASACGVKPKDTIKIKNQEGFSISTPQRDTLFSVQTPQCFKYELIMECHQKIKEDNILVTDDTMVVEKYGHKVFLYEGSYKNIKITTPEDIFVAESVLGQGEY
jgi:2-C-methyl-D-erythritol 4-phosphate cytidylyltransferase